MTKFIIKLKKKQDREWGYLTNYSLAKDGQISSYATCFDVTDKHIMRFGEDFYSTYACFHDLAHNSDYQIDAVVVEGDHFISYDVWRNPEYIQAIIEEISNKHV